MAFRCYKLTACNLNQLIGKAADPAPRIASQGDTINGTVQGTQFRSRPS